MAQKERGQRANVDEGQEEERGQLTTGVARFLTRDAFATAQALGEQREGVFRMATESRFPLSRPITRCVRGRCRVTRQPVASALHQQLSTRPLFGMQQLNQLEQSFVDNLPTIRRTSGALCRRYGIAPDDVEDVTSWITTRIVEDEYAVFRKFRHDSSITTYLVAVVASLFRDYRVQRWGRWRPSALAVRRGPLAVRLETLVVRDKMPLRQAAELLRSAGETDMSDRELAQLLAELPARAPLRPLEVGADALSLHADAARADDYVLMQGADEERQAILRALDQAVDALGPEDQVIVRLKFWHDATVADIARALGLDQKPLYRRLERALADLRARLERDGVSGSELAFLAEHSS